MGSACVCGAEKPKKDKYAQKVQPISAPQKKEPDREKFAENKPEIPQEPVENRSQGTFHRTFFQISPKVLN